MNRNAVALSSLALALLVAWRNFRAQFPCPDAADATHEWAHESGDGRWYLRCARCGRVTGGWEVVRRSA